MSTVLRVRRLGRVPYREALDLQRALHTSDTDHLLLLEHPHVYTLGSRADPRHVLRRPAAVGAELVHTDRGGDVTYHGPGQLVAYPIVDLDESPAGMRDVVGYVRALEAVVIDTLGAFGVRGSREDGLTGVWVGSAKVAAIGVRVARGRTMHGLALNVDPDLAMFEHIVPCGLRDRGVTSLAELLGPEVPEIAAVETALVAAFLRAFPHPVVDEQAVTPAGTQGVDLGALDGRRRRGGAEPAVSPVRSGPPLRLLGRLAAAGVAAPAPDPTFRRPDWMRVRADLGPGYRELKRLMRGMDLTTVCEEAGCPNIYECWADRTATFMILGERCTRACGFCLVDTRLPLPPDPGEPERVAETVARLGLAHAVITSVARDDLPDGGAAAFAATIDAVRRRNPSTSIEVLIPDFRGDAGALETVIHARPDVLNHNLETVARLQRAVRPSAGYARSLVVLARAHAAGLTAKSGIILGLGEDEAEVRAALADLRAVGVDLVTLGQYLRPSERHLPVVRWWTPGEFAAIGEHARGLGFRHVESGPLVRSSYHARAGAVASARPHEIAG